MPSIPPFPTSTATAPRVAFRRSRRRRPRAPIHGNAGAYSPFYIRITRNDGEQEITGFASQLPAGLTANLSGVPFCSEADIELPARRRALKRKPSPACPPRAKSDTRSPKPASARCSRRPRGSSTWRPLRRRPVLGRRDHQRARRPVRPRDRRRAPAARHQPGNGGGDDPRGRRRSDPAHHQRDRHAHP